ncbi:hypothetical protein K7432_002897 [Basidiobolus ranarum]|uniref:GDSL esterase/lipase n=1 Tax=Basidiobolus ranarum TaxID=34480 RepID=A0ABR2W807_9FUNG
MLTVERQVIQGYSGFSGDLPVPSIADQIETHREFIESNPNEIHTRSTLYVVVESGNDYIYGGPTVTPELVAKNIYRTSKALFELPFSAKHFMYANIALDHLPFSMSLNATTRDLVRLSRQKHNRILKTLFRSNTELKAKVFDMNGFLEEELSSRRYVNAKNSCIQTSNVLNVIPKICKNPDKKVFWDLFHLTTTAHRRLAHAIIKDAASLSIGIDSFGY